MKLEFYFDVYPWTTQSNIGVFTVLCWSKGSDCKRYRVEVEVPDPTPVVDMILKADAVEIKDSVSPNFDKADAVRPFPKLDFDIYKVKNRRIRT